MLLEIAIFLNLCLSLLLCLGVVRLWRRSAQPDLGPRLEVLKADTERLERAVRQDIAAEFGRAREETEKAGRTLREEVASRMTMFSEGMQSWGSALRQEVTQSLVSLGEAQHQRLDAVVRQTNTLTQTLTETMQRGLDKLREENTAKLEQMRQTVDEKLQGTLKERLGESFARVSQQLQEVHKGLGEMQTLATGVGDLKKVLANVKVRGGWGEMQLGSLLEQVLATEQFVRDARVKEGSREVVEYAIRLPGNHNGGERETLLPIDAKFPLEDYERLLDAETRGDLGEADSARKQLEQRIKACAKDISDKYIAPPVTTNFAILFLPSEGLYHEVMRRPGLADFLQQKHRVILSGPTNLWGLLNALQIGFKTLAIQQRSGEIEQLLGKVKTEFGKYAGILDKVKKKLTEASNVVDEAGVRTRAIQRSLRSVEALPAPDSPEIGSVTDRVLLELSASDAEDELAGGDTR